MGRVIDGEWTEDDGDLFRNDGFVRLASRYNDEIPDEVVEAMTGEPRRYFLVASLSCPWSHRALVMHRIKSLEAAVPVKVASGRRNEGYPVDENRAWRLPGTGRDVTYVHEVYTASDEGYTGSASVPLLWDSANRRVVSNDSLQIMKAFDRVDSCLSDDNVTLYPEDLRHEIDELNDQIFLGLANGVYRAGLARSQRHYDDAVADVFETLDLLETRLARGRLLFGRRLTLSDLVLFPVLARFDVVYHTHFRCTRRRLADYPMLWDYARDLIGWGPFATDVDFDAIRSGYFLHDGDHNPHGIISERPDCDWSAPHARDAFGAPLVSLRAGGVAEFKPPAARANDNQAGSR